MIVGSSGSGKSTLLNMIGLLDKPTSGKVILDHTETTQLTDSQVSEYRNKKLGFVFQFSNLLQDLTVLENVMLPQQINQDSDNVIQKAKQLLLKVGLEDQIPKRANKISGGQAQRVAIARALAMDPVLMLFDEPTSALDPELVSEVLNVLRRLADDGMTMIIVTHELGFASQVADRVAFMENGKIIEEGPPNEILKTPKTERLHLFLEKLNSTAFTKH